MKDLPDYIKFKTFPGYDLKDVFIAPDLILVFIGLLGP
jgi:hypothetical protein